MVPSGQYFRDVTKWSYRQDYFQVIFSYCLINFLSPLVAKPFPRHRYHQTRKPNFFIKTNDIIQTSWSTSYIFNIGNSPFQKVPKTRSKTQDNVFGLQKFFRKKEKNEVRMILNIITGIFVWAQKISSIYLALLLYVDNQTRYKLPKLHTRKEAPLFSRRLFTTRIFFYKFRQSFVIFEKRHCCCYQETSKKNCIESLIQNVYSRSLRKIP